MGNCMVCGASHASCGPRTTVIPVDERLTEGATVALKKYVVQVQNRRSTHETIMNLTPEEAEKLGATEYEKKAAKPAANKARTPRNKAAKPAANKAPETEPEQPSSPVDDATDPDATEA